MRIKHIMTKNPTCSVPSDSAQRAASIMRHEHAGIVPVIDNEQSRRIVGVVTDRDLCMTVVAEGRDPRAVPVEQCMTTTVVTCSPADSVESVTELMRENQIRQIPVVDERGELRGIVALADVVGRAKIKARQTHARTAFVDHVHACPHCTVDDEHDFDVFCPEGQRLLTATDHATARSRCSSGSTAS
jgi:CBS domain-containing protein